MGGGERLGFFALESSELLGYAGLDLELDQSGAGAIGLRGGRRVLESNELKLGGRDGLMYLGRPL